MYIGFIQKTLALVLCKLYEPEIVKLMKADQIVL